MKKKDIFKTLNWLTPIFFAITFILSLITCNQTCNYDAQLKQITYSLKRENFINSDSLIIKALKTENYAKRDSLLIIALKKPSYADRDSLLAVIKTKEFGEQYYLNQQGIQSDRIIMFVLILFTAFTFLGYTSFSSQLEFLKEMTNKKLDNFEKENKQKIEDLKQETLKKEKQLENDYEIQKKDLVELEEGIYNLQSESFKSISDIHLERENYGKAFYYLIGAAYFHWKSGKSRSFKIENIAPLIDNLQEVLELIKNINSKEITLNDSQKEDIKNIREGTKKILEKLGVSKSQSIKDLCFNIRFELRKFEEKEDGLDDNFDEDEV